MHPSLCIGQSVLGRDGNLCYENNQTNVLSLSLYKLKQMLLSTLTKLLSDCKPSSLSDMKAKSRNRAPLFSRLGVLDIFQVNSFNVAKFSFCYHNKLLPWTLLDLFVTSCQAHSYDLRTATEVVIDHMPVVLILNSIQYFIWIQKHITGSSNFPTFNK